jgi:uncharacterized protein YdaT
MDIKKYIKNKDIEINENDIDIEKLEKDLRKGYELSSDVDEKIKSAIEEAKRTSKTEYDKLKGEYDSLQTNITEYEKRNTDLAERNKTLSLQNVMVKEGFKEEDFNDISSMRYSMYAEEKDDLKAIQGIKEKFKDTYFPSKPEAPVVQKDSTPLNNGTVQPTEIKVSRNTSIKDLMKK